MESDLSADKSSKCNQPSTPPKGVDGLLIAKGSKKLEFMKSRINKIEYIVNSNPEMVAEMLANAGFSVQDDQHELIEAAKEWVRLDGKLAIAQLIKAHPDTKLILETNLQKEEDSFCGCEASFSGGCGCQSSYSGELSELDLKEELGQLNYKELKERYTELKELLSINPENLGLKQELEATWSMLSQTMETDKEHSNESEESVKKEKEKVKAGFQCTITKKDLVFGGVILGLAFVISRI